MRLTLGASFFVLLFALLACHGERGDAVAERSDARDQARTTTKSEASATNESPAASATSAQTGLAWGDKIAWHSWDSALRVARSEGKSIGLVVYAEWCNRCKELAPVFTQSDVASAARGLVMVLQDQDENPTWLKEQLGAYGGYVPRVLFLGPDGNVREDLTSGHPRYPHFYSPLVREQLIANMRAAAAR